MSGNDQLLAAASSGAATPAIQNSLRFRASASAYLSRTFGTPTNNKKFTVSFWVKRGLIGSQQYLLSGRTDDSNRDLIGFDGNDNLWFLIWTGGGPVISMVTTAKYRDPGALLHVVVGADTSQATSGAGYSLEVNGVAVTSFGTSTWTQNSATYMNQAAAVNIGRYMHSSPSGYLDGVVGQYCFVDGQKLAASTFGATDATSGEWKPKTSAAIRTGVGTWGNNGFLLMFNDTTSTTTLGYDRQVSDTGSASNNWTCNNISLTAGVTYDAFIDSPNNGATATQPVGNYATLNPLSKGSAGTVSDGNLKYVTGGANSGVIGTLAIPTTGKWYWEFKVTAGVSTTNALCGMIGATQADVASCRDLTAAGNRVLVRSDGAILSDGTTPQTGLTAWSTNDVIGCAFDSGANSIQFYRNNSTYGTAVTPTAGVTWTPHCGTAASTGTFEAYFGANPLVYSPPSGYKALCTANLGTPAIDKPSLHFDAKTRTGTGASYSVTGLGFSPDLVWVKGRSGATDHAIYDAVRGATYQLESNTTTDETTEATGLTAFNSDGYSGGALAQMNTNTATYIDWFWNESATAGFDIVTYTGNGSNRTINHSLSAVPKMMIVKSRTTAGADTNWAVYHASLANTEYLLLNSTNAKATGATYWNSTTPTSSVFSLGTHADVNTNSDTYVAYLFAEIPGFSKFGSYTGNGSADGPFVFCGFRPRWVMWKRSDTAGNNWCIEDALRSAAYNPADGELLPSSSAAESTSFSKIDLTANGFKFRSSNAGENANTGTYIFAAFAESPLQYANAR